MNVDSMTVKQMADAAAISEDKEQLRNIATNLGIVFSGNTGVDTLKDKIAEETASVLADDETDVDEDDPIMQALRQKQSEPAAPKKPKERKYSPEELQKMNPREKGIPEHLRRSIVRAKAMKLIRCRINNLDPNDSQVTGAIITVYNKYTGKVSKYIPFGEENEHGYHIPQILFNELKTRTFNLRKEVKTPGGSFGVKQYKTVQQKKFALEVLPDLTAEEINNLANDQKARGAIDQTV